jgi:beta-glucanase (GH16 family)
MEAPGSSDIDWNNVELVWSEEFSASSILDDIWVFEPRNTTNPDIADQLQIYRKENVSLSGGTLKIYAKEKAGVYTSARLNSKYAFQYGRIEISVKLPEQEKEGIWAKLALIGNNENTVGWPQCGEIDLMEYFSYKPNETYINVHSSANNAMNGTLITANNYLESIEEEFHAYGILWTDNYIKFYIDDIDNIIYTLNRPSSPTAENWPFDKPFYLLADLVIGGKHAGVEGVDDSLFPAIMEIDYIRVYHTQ